jgi:peptidoglycan-N-acetylglucosamine deacetylase
MARRALLGGLGVLAASLLVYLIEPLAAFTVLERLTPQLVYRVMTNQPLVALSFDDGPHPTFTPQVLDILERHGAKATFFLIGERALRHPDLVARIRRQGHEVGNHYFNNGSILAASETDFLDVLDRTERAIGIGGPPRLFRPPGGVAWSRQLELVQSRGYVCVLGSGYPHDPARPPVASIRWLTAAGVPAAAPFRRACGRHRRSTAGPDSLGLLA